MTKTTKRKQAGEAETKAKPVLHIQVGGVRIPIWCNQGEAGPYFKAGHPELSYRSGDEWKAAKSFGAHDLIHLVKAACLAHSEILQRNRTSKATESPAEAESE